MNLTEPLRRIARERPEATAVLRARGAPLSYPQLDALVDAVARRCVDAGIRPGDVVHVAIRGPFRQLVLQLALARLGAAASAYVLPPSVAAASLVERDDDLRMHPKARAVDAAWFAPVPPATPFPMHEGGAAAAALCPSSGTTGPSKAIPVSHAQMQARIVAADAGAPLPAATRAIAVPSPATGYGYVSALRVLHAGGAVAMAATPEDIVAMTRAHAVNRLVTVPFWIAPIVDALAPGERLATLEQIEVAGSFLTRRLHDLACERLGGRLHCVYGVTEAGCVAIAPFDRLDLEAGEVGDVLPGYELAAFDEADRRLPPGEAGALRVRGAACSERYVGDPRASAEAFRDGWVVTPDLGSVAADGRVTLAGRLSEQIVVGRERVRPAAVEEALLANDAIVDAAAFGAPDRTGATRLCAAVVARGPLDTAALGARIAATLGVASPAFVMRVEALPRNAAGKVMRATLAAMARDAGIGQA